MKKTGLLFLAATTFCGSALAQSEVPAFPGAEGNGRYVTGGRGGKIVHVTNLNNSGSGSFRAAVSGNDPKIVVFDVGGVIALNSAISIGQNTTILGQTAPYPGITLRYYTVSPSSNNVVRFLRVRRGEEKDIDDGADAMWARQRTGIILDHCSFSWSIDEVASFYDNNNFTMQWCTVGEALCNPGHTKGQHGYGGIWGGKLTSFHHNMIAHVDNRAPRFNGARYNWGGYTSNYYYDQYKWENALQAENVDFRNCVVFDWGSGGCYGGPGGGYINMVNNYYRSTSSVSRKNRVTTVSTANSTTSSDNDTYLNMTSRYFISGNYVSGYGANYDWKGVVYDSGIPSIGGQRYTPDPNHYYGSSLTYTKNASGVDCLPIKLDEAMAPAGTVTTHAAEDAYEKVLAYSGASLFRDDVDARYASEAKAGESQYTGKVTKKKGLIDFVADVDGYTENNFPKGSRPAGWDSDNDGMPDAWETANGLNPNNASDANAYTLDPRGMYTNIEVYASAIVEDIMQQGNAGAQTAVDEYYPAANKAEGIDYYSGIVVERVDPNANEDDEKDDDVTTIDGTKGNISWAMNTGAAEDAVFQEAVAEGFTTSAITVGSNLNYAGSKTTGGVTETLFQPNAQESGAAESNLVTFAYTVKEGYVFQPTRVSFTTSRFGTDGGKLRVVYVSPAAETTLATEYVPTRNNAASGYFSEFSEAVTGIAAQGGTHELQINIYSLGNTKQVGFANIVIDGVLASVSGISQPARVVIPVDEPMYNLSGQRVGKGYKGIVIKGGKKMVMN